MAINLTTTYTPARVDTTDPVGYPVGANKNETAPGANDGTPVEAALQNDYAGSIQATIYQAGLVPDNTPEKVSASQVLQGLARHVSGSITFDDSGVADAYVLSPTAISSTDFETPSVYFHGMQIQFYADNPSTASGATVNVNAIGDVGLVQPDGSILSAGFVTSDIITKATYDGVSGKFIITFSAGTVVETGTLPNMYFSGLTIANGSDADHDIDVGAGSWRSIADDEDIILTSTFVKQIDATWIAGTNVGGLANGANLAIDTWYHVFAVNVAGVADIMFDDDIDCANGVANNAVTAYRYLHSVLTDGSSNILPFIYANGRTRWVDQIIHVDGSPGNSRITVNIGTPLDVVVTAQMSHNMGNSTAVTSVIIMALDETDVVPAIGNATTLVEANARRQVNNFEVKTDTNSGVAFRSSDLNIQNNQLITIGWYTDRSSI